LGPYINQKQKKAWHLYLRYICFCSEDILLAITLEFRKDRTDTIFIRRNGGKCSKLKEQQIICGTDHWLGNNDLLILIKLLSSSDDSGIGTPSQNKTEVMFSQATLPQCDWHYLIIIHIF
jgi:hypothetical protein